jgi:flagellar hook-associated protein 3 FlgL
MTYISRITNNSIQDSILNGLYTNRSVLTKLQEQVSTGKKVSTPSDDPSATYDILSSNQKLNKIDSYIKNIDHTLSETQTIEDVLQNSLDLIQRAKELTVQASNSTNSTTELKAINVEIEQISNSLKDIGNTQFGSKYLFGGLDTANPPFTSPVDGEVHYEGTPYSSSGEHKRYVEISEGIKIEVNIAGDDVFGYYTATAGSGVFNTLQTLSNELTTDPPDHEAIRSKIDEIDNDLTNLINAQAKIGGISTRLEMTKSKLENDNINFTKLKSNAEDIDLAKAISDMTFQQTALQASLKVGANVIQSSLLDFI